MTTPGRDAGVVVFRFSTELQEFGENDTLIGEGIFKGFTLAVTSLFAV